MNKTPCYYCKDANVITARCWAPHHTYTENKLTKEAKKNKWKQKDNYSQWNATIFSSILFLYLNLLWETTLLFDLLWSIWIFGCHIFCKHSVTSVHTFCYLFGSINQYMCINTRNYIFFYFLLVFRKRLYNSIEQKLNLAFSTFYSTFTESAAIYLMYSFLRYFCSLYSQLNHWCECVYVSLFFFIL